MKRISIVLIFSVLVFASCKTDDDNNNSDNRPASASYENPQLSGTSIQTDFIGQITNQNGDPVANAIVKVGEKQFATNNQGLYKITNATVDKDFALISISSNGYYNQFRNLKPKVNQVNNVDVTLIPKAFNAGFASADGGTVNVPGGATVVFAPNSLVDSEGNTFSGNVIVASTYLNPTDIDLPRYMPGSLLAVDDSGDLTSMLTYGMIGLELFSSSGQSLQLAEGASASVEFPIQSEQSAYAPSEIPLWFFDEVDGIWREEGIATRLGDVYQCELAHFTFWNCDANFDESYYLSGTLVIDGETNSTEQLYLRVYRSDGSYTGGFTDQYGYFSGLVPGNESLVLEVNSGSCNSQVIMTLNVDPLTEDTDLGIMDIEVPSDQQLNFSGTIVDCNNDPLSGVSFVYQNSSSPWNGGYVVSDESGNFSFTSQCPTSGTLNYELADFDDNLVGISGELDFDMANTNTYDFGTLSFCDAVIDVTYFNYSEGSNSFNFPYIQVSDSLVQMGGCVNIYAQLQPGIFSEYAAIDFGHVTAPGVAPTCSSESGFITSTMANGDTYQASLVNYTVTITDVDILEDQYTVLEGNYSTDAIVTITGSNGNIVDEYTTTASGNFRYQE